MKRQSKVISDNKKWITETFVNEKASIEAGK